MISRIFFHKELSEHFAESNSFLLNPPTILHPILTATILLEFLFFTLRTALSAFPFVSDRSFDDSMVIIHMICQIPVNCQCEYFLASVTVRETYVNSFRFLRSFCFARTNFH